MRWFQIILLSIATCVAYGILHDQITARICVEYFTIGHAPIFGTENPTLLGIGWGFLATWWVGAFLGIPLACFCRFGGRPRWNSSMLVRPLLILCFSCAAFATLAGVVGNISANNGWVVLFEPLASRVPPQKHVAFLTDLWIHNASYVGGFVGGLLLMAYVWRDRQKLAVSQSKNPNAVAR